MFISFASYEQINKKETEDVCHGQYHKAVKTEEDKLNLTIEARNQSIYSFKTTNIN